MAHSYFAELAVLQTDLGARINGDYLADEERLVRELAGAARSPPEIEARVGVTATEFIRGMRDDRASMSALDAFLVEYDLSSREGVALMCLAEALLRIPDADTADRLIADRLADGDWSSHLGESDSVFVNASTWGLMLTGQIVEPESDATDNPAAFLRALIARLGEPVLRSAMRQAMRVMAEQFVMGRNIESALQRAATAEFANCRFSFDMLGEAALTAGDAQGYADAYRHAIEIVGAQQSGPPVEPQAYPGVSVKLSALSPRFEFAQYRRACDEITSRLTVLAECARAANVPLTVDAEESDRLELTLAIFAAVFAKTAAGGWPGLGIAVQAYQRRSRAVINWLAELGAAHGCEIPVRLVKGAYWDTEIKRAQERGLDSYPVFTRKVNTDVAYLACAQALLARADTLRAQFATHNAHTVAWLLHNAPRDIDYEFQRLHGMGESLYRQVQTEALGQRPCRVYAPVGPHEDLLPYLVRRLLENGANTSFVNRIVQEDTPIAELVEDPATSAARQPSAAHPGIPAPAALYGTRRGNSKGINFCDGAELAGLAAGMDRALRRDWLAEPRVGGDLRPGAAPAPAVSPADRNWQIGRVSVATAELVGEAARTAVAAFADWNARPVTARAAILRQVAEVYEAERASLLALCVAEGGRSLRDAAAEVREAVDFLRYYASEAEGLMSVPRILPGPTGERNELELLGRGVFACISPWNFPLAIFTGQIAAALVTGNTVLAKPAEQTSLVAAHASALLYAAGVPGDVLQFLPGAGDIGAAIVGDAAITGVAFTGSVETAWQINRALAARDAPIATLIAETGGQNAMIVDSTALAEQVVADVVQSAFNSAGQRCSALRVLFLQQEIAPRVLELLLGHLPELRLGSPAALSTDLGPVIDAAQLDMLAQHRNWLASHGQILYEGVAPDGVPDGYYQAPIVAEISDISILKREIFGPILHILRFDRRDLPALLERIGATGYGLTAGLQTRIQGRIDELARRLPVGNVYANRNMIGAVVGSQPFGGQALSGTGPKAGGPHYLPRFTRERSLSVNTAAIGGNAALLSLPGD